MCRCARSPQGQSASCNTVGQLSKVGWVAGNCAAEELFMGRRPSRTSNVSQSAAILTDSETPFQSVSMMQVSTASACSRGVQACRCTQPVRPARCETRSVVCFGGTFARPHARTWRKGRIALRPMSDSSEAIGIAAASLQSHSAWITSVRRAAFAGGSTAVH